MLGKQMGKAPYLLIALIAVQIIRFPLIAGHDVAFALHLGRLLSEGRIPYVDFFEPNPPLVLYLNVIPVVLADKLSVNAIPVALWLVLVLLILSTLQIHVTLMKRVPQAELVVTGWVLYSFWIYFTLDFGQREYLFGLAYLPFFLLRAFRMHEDRAITPWWNAAFWGVAAGIMASLKPFFALTALVPEIYWFARRPSRRYFRSPELIAFLGTGTLYALHFLLIPSEMRNALFGRWVPLLLHHYSAYNDPLAELLNLRHVELVLPMAALGLYFYRLTSTNSVPGVLWTGLALVTTFGFFLNYLLMGKFWLYHAIVADTAAVLLILFALVRPREGMASASSFEVVSKKAGMLLLFVFFLICIWARPFAWDLTQIVPDDFRQLIENNSKRGDGVLVISTSIWPMFPLFEQIDRRQVARYSYAFPIPMAYAGVTQTGDEFPYHTQENFPPWERLYLRELDEDLERGRPSLIVIQRDPCMACAEGLDLVDYLRTVGFTGKLLDYQSIGFTPSGRFYSFRLRGESLESSR